jgi:hypothetical protein
MGIIKIYHDKKWTLQFLDALYNSIDIFLIILLHVIIYFNVKTLFTLNITIYRIERWMVKYMEK